MDTQTLIKKFNIKGYEAQDIVVYLEQIGVGDTVFNNIKAVATNYDELSEAIKSSLNSNRSFIIFKGYDELDIATTHENAVNSTGKDIYKIYTDYRGDYGCTSASIRIATARKIGKIYRDINSAIENSTEDRVLLLNLGSNIYGDILGYIVALKKERGSDAIFSAIVCPSFQGSYETSPDLEEELVQNFDIICCDSDFDWLLKPYKEKYAEKAAQYPNLDKFLNGSDLSAEDFKEAFNNAEFLEYVIEKLLAVFETRSQTEPEFFDGWDLEKAFMWIDCPCLPEDSKIYKALCAFFAAIGIPE